MLARVVSAGFVVPWVFRGSSVIGRSVVKTGTFTGSRVEESFLGFSTDEVDGCKVVLPPAMCEELCVVSLVAGNWVVWLATCSVVEALVV